MSARISQREARRLKKRVAELEAIERRRNEAWTREWFGGTDLCVGLELGEGHPSIIALRTARRLGHYVVAVDDRTMLRLYAVRQGK